MHRVGRRDPAGGVAVSTASKNSWEFYIGIGGKWRWRASDFNNGKILAVSSQGYANKEDAEKCARRFGWKPL